jgi:hypothetical protein
MNARHLIHGLTIAVAISMPVAAFAYRTEAQPQSAANPPPPGCKLVEQDYTNDKKYERKRTCSSNSLSRSSLSTGSACSSGKSEWHGFNRGYEGLRRAANAK